MAVSRTCRDGRIRKNFDFFRKTGANLTPWLAVTPVERCRCENGKTEYKEQKDGGQTKRTLTQTWLFSKKRKNH